jgi:16S rRNA (cytosine967-C5)-methyltransferase
VEFSLPDWIVSAIAEETGEGDLAAAAAGLSRPAALSIRANALRATRDQVAERLRSEREGIDITPSSLAPHALLVSRLGSPDASESFQDGWWTVQDVGAQMVTRLVEPRPGQRLLDACAGVGGKTTYLAELTQGRASVDAADVSERKLDLLGDTIRRLGLTSIRSIRCDLTRPGSELAESYDAVLLDAPCSGLGVIRRHPEAKWRMRAEEVSELASVQRRLLDALAPRVVPGGCLVYAVCTFTRAEAQAQMASFLDRHREFVPETWIRTWPHLHDADAFFAARLRRRPDA